MAQPLMPKATAMWLIENTALTFEQIAGFCGLHILEGQSMADGEVNFGMVGRDPIVHGQLTKEEIERATCVTLAHCFAQVLSVGEMVTKIEAASGQAQAAE